MKVRVVCGTVDGVQGPVREIRIDPEYLDVEIPAGAVFSHAAAGRLHRLRLCFRRQGVLRSRGKKGGRGREAW